jgi:hypothetical protein
MFKKIVSVLKWGLVCMALTTPAMAQTSAYPKPGAPADFKQAYLFAHMMTGDYGVLYYSVSLDGLHWTFLNKGKPIDPAYHGHASIAQGPDSRYYLVGNKSDDDPYIRFWVSDDLIKWTPYGTYMPDLSKALDHPLQRIGAPKLMFDKASGQFLLTWHTPNVPGTPDEPETYWASQRTLYVTSPDLKTFAAAPKRLFKWEMATIDTVVQPNPDGGYCAVLKDERYPSYNWTTGKTVRITCAPTLTGPYPEPGPSLSPNFREAPTLIRAPNGIDWYLYYEQYAGTSYGLSMAPRLEGPWYQVSGNSGVPEWNRFEMTPRARHGSMIEISRETYDRLIKAYPAAQ